MTAKTLLVDSIGFKLEQLTESAGGGEYVFRGKFAQSDRPTANKRIYRRALWEREIAKLQPKIAQGKIFGELDHPDDGKTMLKRAAVIIRSLSIDESGQIIGEMKILDTINGKEFKAIVDGGGAVGVSSRGYGSVRMDNEGNSVVQDDFTLLTFDPVADPAEETAYPVLTRSETLIPPPVETPAPAAEEASDEEVSDPSPPAPDQFEESVKRDKLNAAIVQARKAYIESSKSVSHKEALNIAVDEAYKGLISHGTYDRKDFQFEVAADVIGIKESKDAIAMEESKKQDSADIQALIKASVQESIASVLAEKDKTIVALQAESAKRQAELEEAKKEVSGLNDAVKELGYGLYIQQHLASHPRLKQIKESVGDLTKIESLAALQTKISVYTAEVTKLSEDVIAKDQSLNESLIQSRAELTETKAKLKTVSKDLKEAITLGLQAGASLYLERRITTSPHAPEMRKRFEEMRDKSIQSVQSLLKEYKGRAVNESSDFSKIRNRLSGGKSKPAAGLVENHVNETNPAGLSEGIDIGQGLQSMDEIRRLSGLNKKFD